MKKILLTIAATVLAQAAHATEVYCGAAIEETAGSNTYNKLVFHDKADFAKSTVRFLLADGSVLKAEDLTYANQAQITDGTLVMGITFNTEKFPTLYTAKVKKNGQNQITYMNTAMSISLGGSSLMLIGNGASVYCKDM